MQLRSPNTCTQFLTNQPKLAMMLKTNEEEDDEEEKIIEVVKIVPYIWPLSPESLAGGLFCKI